MHILHFALRYELDRYRILISSTLCTQYLTKPAVPYETTNHVSALNTIHCARMYAVLQHRMYFYNCNLMYGTSIRMTDTQHGLQHSDWSISTWSTSYACYSTHSWKTTIRTSTMQTNVGGKVQDCTMQISVAGMLQVNDMQINSSEKLRGNYMHVVHISDARHSVGVIRYMQSNMNRHRRLISLSRTRHTYPRHRYPNPHQSCRSHGNRGDRVSES